MNTGHWIGVFLVASLVIFAVWDIWAYKSGRMTLSRLVIQTSKSLTWFGWLALAFAVGIMLVGFWLVLHWELPCILFNTLCWINI